LVITERPPVSIGDEIAITRSRLPRNGKKRAMSERRQFKHSQSLEQRLADEAEKLRDEARGTPPGVERDALMRRARQCETGSQVSEWLRSAGLRTPD